MRYRVTRVLLLTLGIIAIGLTANGMATKCEEDVAVAATVYSEDGCTDGGGDSTGSDGGTDSTTTYELPIQVTTEVDAESVSIFTDLQSSISLDGTDTVIATASETTRVKAVDSSVVLLQDGVIVGTLDSDAGEYEFGQAVIVVEQGSSDVNNCVAQTNYEAFYANVDPAAEDLTPSPSLSLNTTFVVHEDFETHPDDLETATNHHEYRSEDRSTQNPERLAGSHGWDLVGSGSVDTVSHYHVQYEFRNEKGDQVTSLDESDWFLIDGTSEC